MGWLAFAKDIRGAYAKQSVRLLTKVSSPTNICRMSTFKLIRDRLEVTQAALAEGIGCTQANISFYERGQTVPPDAAKRLIAFAKTLGHEVTFDDIYGDTPTEKQAA